MTWLPEQGKYLSKIDYADDRARTPVDGRLDAIFQELSTSKSKQNGSRLLPTYQQGQHTVPSIRITEQYYPQHMWNNMDSKC